MEKNAYIQQLFCFTLFFSKMYTVLYKTWKQLRAIMLENFCAKCMVFVNATNMSRLNISLNQNEFVTPGKKEINYQ